MVMALDRYQVARTWIYRGLSDLYFAFDNDDPAFEDHARFSEIMGLEKCLKAVVLFHEHAEYEHLAQSEARLHLNRIAQRSGHNFRGMFRRVAKLGVLELEQIQDRDFDGYRGEELIAAVSAGYEETRYPVPRPVSDSFPIPGSGGWTHDPLSSSGITRFIYASSGACVRHLEAYTNLADVKRQFRASFGHLPSFERFLKVSPEARDRSEE